MEVKIEDIRMDASWKTQLASEFQKPYFAGIKGFLFKERETGHAVYPK
jgi:uracil DNA glycosylase